MKGWRTLILNAVVVVVTALAGWAVAVDWTQYVSPTTAVVIVAALNLVLRFATTTPACTGAAPLPPQITEGLGEIVKMVRPEDRR